MTEGRRGHSLVELLLALGLLALLAAGVLAFLKGTLTTLARTGDALAARRGLRRAAALLSDDLLEMGFLVPCRDGAPGPLFQLETGRAVRRLSGRALGAAGPGLAGDELTLVKDAVVPGEAHLASALPLREPTLLPAPLVVAAGRDARLHPGDLLIVEDGRWEGVRITAPVALRSARTQEVPVAALDGEGPPFRAGHDAGAPVVLLRPRRVIQYRLVLLEAGPALARLERDAAAPDWEEARIVTEGITGFRVGLPRGPGEALPPLVRVDLEARRGRGPRREATLLCAPRNGGGP